MTRVTVVLLGLLATSLAWAADPTVFLVLLDDGGQAGEPIGCNDSLVPVAVDLGSGRLRLAETPQPVETGAPAATFKEAQLTAARVELLRAAYHTLLALEHPFTAASTPAPDPYANLYNALYLSELRLERVEVEGEAAAVYLEGDFKTGGVCDLPRLEAQLERTAEQFAWVGEVAVFVNGVPLAELLSLR